MIDKFTKQLIKGPYHFILISKKLKNSGFLLRHEDNVYIKEFIKDKGYKCKQKFLLNRPLL